MAVCAHRQGSVYEALSWQAVFNIAWCASPNRVPNIISWSFSDFWTWAQYWEKVVTSIDLWSQADGYGSSTPCWPHCWALLLVTCSTEKWWEPGIVSHVSMM